MLIAKKPEFRKEYKFIVDNRKLDNFYNFYDKIFTNLYPNRKIVSLYFDTVDLKLYKRSLLNDVDKFKFRFRLYIS